VLQVLSCMFAMGRPDKVKALEAALADAKKELAADA
jgi:hypothetical protein